MAEISEKPKSGVVIREFSGMTTKADRHDLPTGMAQVQVNAMSNYEGRLDVRLGYRVVKFES